MGLFSKNGTESQDIDYEAGRRDRELERRGVSRLEPDYGTNTEGLERYRQGHREG